MIEYDGPTLTRWLVQSAPHLAVQLLVPDKELLERFFNLTQADPTLAAFFKDMPVKAIVVPDPVSASVPEVKLVGPSNQLEAARAAAAALALPDLVIFDTETTDKYPNTAEICHIGAIDASGKVLLDLLIKPSKPIPAAVIAIHGITDEMVKDAPTFPEVVDQIAAVLDGRNWAIYNRSFDASLLASLINRYQTRLIKSASEYCAMLGYAKFFGDYNSYHGSYRWQKLTDAYHQQKIEVVDAHNALGDCQMTLALMKRMAELAGEAVSA